MARTSPDNPRPRGATADKAESPILNKSQKAKKPKKKKSK